MGIEPADGGTGRREVYGRREAVVERTYREIREYLTAKGVSPFGKWINSLDEKTARAKIRIRLDRLNLGHFGDCESVGEGVYELRIHFRPGYRIYFGQDNNSIILLLCGGIKSTQTRDILKAKEYWQDYKRRKNE